MFKFAIPKTRILKEILLNGDVRYLPQRLDSPVSGWKSIYVSPHDPVWGSKVRAKALTLSESKELINTFLEMCAITNERKTINTHVIVYP